ncbi:hypothetical protein E1B28_010732 [Marasmius oreades]|uniref:Uncharacterized protein n=1 Tax=Marasmius oreades TaxID=181124 RepID=A0A9P7RSK7_9AGAR|nr:uncharacterized protein E1B28_010732 [Marasmius oreades]KAG7089021.1 hypothetical protein E1B28_010732 [Marasmius oreades]
MPAHTKILSKPISSLLSNAAVTLQLLGDPRIIAGCPMDRYGLPTTIYSLQLARIMEKFRNIEEFYNNEKERENALKKPLKEIFGTAHWQKLVNDRQAFLDAVWDLSMVFEGKNEKGLDGNVQLQGLLSRLHIVQDSKWMESSSPPISPASYSAFRAHPLSPHLDKDILIVARALTILANGLQDLKKCYNDIQIQGDEHANYLFPNPLCQDTLKPPTYGPLTFLEKLSPSDIFVVPDVIRPKLVQKQSTTDRFKCSMRLFHAMMPNKTVIIVKFMLTYNPDTHELLVAEGLAPKLLHCTKIIDNWWMIVMEYLDKAQNAYTYLLNRTTLKLPCSVYNDIKTALRKLHEKKIVFGALRIQNIMVEEDKKHKDGV